MQEQMCESCGAPIGALDEMYGPGTEADGRVSEDFCKQCYQNGAFTNPDISLEEMIEVVADLMVQGFGFDPADAKAQCEAGLPNLKRWKKA